MRRLATGDSGMNGLVVAAAISYTVVPVFDDVPTWKKAGGRPMACTNSSFRNLLHTENCEQIKY